jgi:chorismate-pyruvate lyase
LIRRLCQPIAPKSQRLAAFFAYVGPLTTAFARRSGTAPKLLQQGLRQDRATRLEAKLLGVRGGARVWRREVLLAFGGDFLQARTVWSIAARAPMAVALRQLGKGLLGEKLARQALKRRREVLEVAANRRVSRLNSQTFTFVLTEHFKLSEQRSAGKQQQRSTAGEFSAHRARNLKAERRQSAPLLSASS